MSSKIRNSYFKMYLQIYFTLSRENFGLQTVKLLSRKLYLSVWNGLVFSVQVFDWSIWGKKLKSTGKIICSFIASGGTEENFNCSSSVLIVAYTDVHQHTRCIHACTNMHVAVDFCVIFPCVTDSFGVQGICQERNCSWLLLFIAWM